MEVGRKLTLGVWVVVGISVGVNHLQRFPHLLAKRSVRRGEQHRPFVMRTAKAFPHVAIIEPNCHCLVVGYDQVTSDQSVTYRAPARHLLGVMTYSRC